MEFIAEKDAGLIPFVLSQILDTCVNGITLSDPDQEDNPIVYANEAFEMITGYGSDEILGKNCRFLQGEDSDQEEALDKVSAAIRARQQVTVTLRNYRKNGELFYNSFSIRPLFDHEGRLLYFLGVQYDITNQVEAEQELNRLNQLLGQT